MTSYLRLGAVADPALAASPAAAPWTGEDLAAEVTSFVDDTRQRDVCPDFVPEAVRQAETAKLHTKGGWRDHSDGNRITTTRGDKVEVIKGNHRLLILGRQHDAAGWDNSGGHIGAGGITFAGESSIRWVENYDGTWRAVEETAKGDVCSTYQGDTREFRYGNFVESWTGRPAPFPGRENPAITERTWAARIASYTGSAALPVPKITSETWGGAITSRTRAKTITDSTETCSVTSKTDVSGEIKDDTSAGDMVSTTTAGAIIDTTTAGAMVSTTVCPVVLDTTIGTTTSVIVGHEAEIVAGNMTEITAGAQESLTMGALIDITVALMLDVCIAGRVDIRVGAALEYDAEAKLDVTPARLKTRIADIEDSAGSTLAAAVDSVAAALTTLF